VNNGRAIDACLHSKQQMKEPMVKNGGRVSREEGINRERGPSNLPGRHVATYHLPTLLSTRPMR
jgi:hypothetical protein